MSNDGNNFTPATQAEDDVKQDTTPAAEDSAKAEQPDKKKAFDQKQQAMQKSLVAGTLHLEEPLRAGGKDVAELQYDFQKINGWEYAEAMDSDKGNVFTMSSRQAFALFAKAAAKETPGVDEIDIKERLGALDAMEAVQITLLFFRVSAQIRNRRTYSA